MSSIGENSELCEELLQAVIVQITKDSELLKKAIADRNLPLIKSVAHSIKGACLNMWFHKMAELAIEFELYLDKDHFIELEELFEALMVEWAQVKLIIE